MASVRLRSRQAARIVATLTVAVACCASSTAQVAGSVGTSTLVVDDAFGVRGRLEIVGWSTVAAIVPKADGSALVVVERLAPDGTVVRTGILRVSSDGTLDPAFAPASATPGRIEVDGVADVLFRASGAIVVGNRQYRPDGAVDTGFGVDGWVSSSGGIRSGMTIMPIEFPSGALATLIDRPLDLGGCGIAPIGPDGVLGASVEFGIECPEAVWTQLPDGSTTIVARHTDASAWLVSLDPGGTLERPPVPVTAGGGIIGRLVDVAPGPPGEVVLQTDELSSSSLLAIDQAGADDPGFTRTVIAGTPLSVHRIGTFILVGSASTIGVHPGAPPSATVSRVLPSGRPDVGFGSGAHPGSLDTRELGVTEYTIAGAIEPGIQGAVWFGLAVGAGVQSATVLRALEASLRPIDPAVVSRRATRVGNSYPVA